MTTATMALTELAEKGADIDVLRQMVRHMAQRLLGHARRASRCPWVSLVSRRPHSRCSGIHVRSSRWLAALRRPECMDAAGAPVVPPRYPQLWHNKGPHVDFR
jgi:hypothetical protein